MKIDHIGVAVRSIQEAEKLYLGALGAKEIKRETLAHMQLKILKVELGGVAIELLEPADDQEPVIARFLRDRGEGIHHLCYEVPDIRKAQADLAAKGYRAVWPEPRLGSQNKLVTFLHPKQTHGVLIELSQR